MNKNYFAIWDTENKKFITADEAVNAGADPSSNAVSHPFPELFSEDDSELAFMIHEANKQGEWKVVPVTVDIKITITPK